ncbi:MAG: hypothetical protein OHK0046_24270 [Anaerolineae bacterium]
MIPLRGEQDSAHPKAPALASWKVYQQRPPTPEEINQWSQQYDVYGVVLGQVSRLIVIDIDTERASMEFAKLLPDLTHTFTVCSGNRQLPHYYFRLPIGIEVGSRRYEGAELRSDGSYVVAPGATIYGKTWDVIQNVAPLLLSESDLSRILGFVGVVDRKGQETGRKPALNAKLSPSITDGDPVELTASGLVRRYRQLAAQGRNNALFQTACYARDRGWSAYQIEQALLQAHVEQPPVTAHPPETPQQREAEGVNTIASAFTRPARKVQTGEPKQPQLPNAVREWFLQHGLVNVARVLDGLLLKGVEVGQALTAGSVYDLLAELGIGRNTVFTVLNTVLESGQRLFELVFSPPAPPSLYANADSRSAVVTNQCLFGRVAKPGKNRGRPVRHFLMPSIQAVCDLIGVHSTKSDQLKNEAVQSPRAYRAALHVALFKRAPGQYARGWLAARLGISKDTCRRYERCAEVMVSSTYNQWRLNWRTIDKVVPEEQMAGQFIQDEKGKKYPPIRGLAARLLRKGKQLIYCVQETNHYQLADALILAGTVRGSKVQTTPMPESALKPLKRIVARFAGQAEAQPEAESTSAQAENQAAEVMPEQPESTSTASAEFMQKYASPFPQHIDENQCATKLYETLRKMNPQKSLTRWACMGMVNTYGVKRVEKALRITQQQKSLKNPAGFFRMWLHSQSLNTPKKATEPKRTKAKKSRSKTTAKPQNQTPKTAAEKHEAWLQKLKKYSQFFVNSDEIDAL